MPGRGKPANKSNGPLNGISSTLKKDYESMRRSYGDYKSGQGASRSMDRGLKRLGRGSYRKGMMKGAGYMGGAMIGLDWLFD